MKNPLILLLVALFLSGCLSTAPKDSPVTAEQTQAAKAAPAKIEKPSLFPPTVDEPSPQPIAWLKDKQFARLEAYLDALYQHVKQKPEDEYILTAVYTPLSQQFETLGPFIEPWLAQSPDSFEGKLLFAAFLQRSAMATALYSPSHGWASNEIKLAFLGKMRASQQILEPLYKSKPDHPFLNRYYVEACSGAEMACVEKAAKQVDAFAPHAYFARRSLLGLLTPRWGRTTQDMRPYLKQMEEQLPQNPHWKALLGYPDFALCAFAREQRRPVDALAYCEKAWKEGGPEASYFALYSVLLGEAHRIDDLRDYGDEVKRQYPIPFYARLVGNYIADAYVALARRNYIHLKTSDAPIKFLIAAIGEAPQRFDLYENLRQLLQEVGRSGEVIPYLESYIGQHAESDRTRAKAYLYLAEEYSKMKNDQAVDETLAKACQLGNASGCVGRETFQKVIRGR